MTSPIDSGSMSPLTGGKTRRGEESATKSATGESSSGTSNKTNADDQVSISTTGSQLNVAPRVVLEDSAQASSMVQTIKAAFADHGAQALAAQGAKVKGELQGLL